MSPPQLVLTILVCVAAIVLGLVAAVRAVRRKRITPPPGPQVSPRANPPPSDPP